MMKERRGEERRRQDKTNKGNAMVFGDNVRARRAARALPRTPTQEGEEEDREKRKTNDEPPHHMSFYPTQTITAIPQ